MTLFSDLRPAKSLQDPFLREGGRRVPLKLRPLVIGPGDNGEQPDANAARRARGELEAREEFHSDTHLAGWDDRQGRVARTGGFERSVGRWRSCEGVSRGAMVDTGKGSVRNRRDRGAMMLRMLAR